MTFQKILKALWINTPLGAMVAVSDDDALYHLMFATQNSLEAEIACLQQKSKIIVIPEISLTLTALAFELQAYFEGTLTLFKTPIQLVGSPFQTRAWKALLRIPYGQTRSYREQAQSIGNPNACRAVANANGANQLAIIVPCHRIINANGKLGGYTGGIARKKWLIEHEEYMTRTSMTGG